jgi:hypothetical protein
MMEKREKSLIARLLIVDCGSICQEERLSLRQTWPWAFAKFGPNQNLGPGEEQRRTHTTEGENLWRSTALLVLTCELF